MAKDLISKYGEGRGVREDTLRKSLRLRSASIAGGVLTVLGTMGGLMFIDPMIPLYILMICAAVGAVLALGRLGIWFLDDFPDHLENIKIAKKYGVYEDK